LRQPTAVDRWREKRWQTALRELDSDDKIVASNRKTLHEFLEFSRANGIGTSRLTIYVYKLMKLDRLLDKDFRRANRKDMEKAMAKIEGSSWSDWTKYTFKAVVRRFYQWLRKMDDDYPEEVKWIKLRMKHEGRLLPEELLTEEDVKRLAEAADNPRDRALVLTLYESGCRIGEILALRIRNVEFDKYGAVLIFPSGKTGMRRVRIIASAPALSEWIGNHPQRGNASAGLWTLIGTVHHGMEMDYPAAARTIQRLVEKTGLKKRANPHMFRHSRASHLAKVLTEAQMKTYLGWVPGSDMAATYVHLSGRDVDSTLLKMNGIAETETRTEPVIKIVVCPRCQQKAD